jgi:hypothetical protein
MGFENVSPADHADDLRRYERQPDDVPSLTIPSRAQAQEVESNIGASLARAYRIRPPADRIAERPTNIASEEVGSMLLGLTVELSDLHPSYHPPYDSEDYKDMTMTQAAYECYGAYTAAGSRLTGSIKIPSDPQFELTQKVIQEQPGFRMQRRSINKRGCFQAELRLIRDLARQQSGQGLKIDRLPAAIISDKQGPFAYLKADGYANAVAWRAGELDTEEGIIPVPAGALFEPLYGEDEALDESEAFYKQDPRLEIVGDARNTGIVSLKHARKPTSAAFLRFTTRYLPPVLRIVAGLNAADEMGATDAKRYIEPAANLTEAALAKRVSALLASGRVIEL